MCGFCFSLFSNHLVWFRYVIRAVACKMPLIPPFLLFAMSIIHGLGDKHTSEFRLHFHTRHRSRVCLPSAVQITNVLIMFCWCSVLISMFGFVLFLGLVEVDTYLALFAGIVSFACIFYNKMGRTGYCLCVLLLKCVELFFILLALVYFIGTACWCEYISFSLFVTIIILFVHLYIYVFYDVK